MSKEGKVVLSKDWPRVEVLESEVGVLEYIKKSSSTSDNVQLVENTNGFPQAVVDWFDHMEMPDYDVEGFEYYKIFHPDDGNLVIGYIAEETTRSPEAEERRVVIARFDLDGNQVGKLVTVLSGLDE